VGLDQVALNLVANARDAMEGRAGAIRIGVQLNGDEVILSVSDDGVGMEPAILEKAVQPLFTTKPEGKGTGLGLSVVERQVAMMGGRVRIQSEVGVGTTVRVSLPHVAAGTGDEAAETPLVLARGTERILVVEDDLAVQVTLSGILEHAGYQVSRAMDVDSARDEFKRDQYNLVISNAVLPDCRDWKDSAEAFPEANVLLVSGYTDAGWPSEGIPSVHKPYSAVQMLRAVRESLDGRIS
jgi:hypothetical protein